MTLRLLDLFCGAGGAAKGYQLAGFEVWGVDLHPQPNYRGERFQQMDALAYVERYGVDNFDAIHASPPCQAYSVATKAWNGRIKRAEHPDLVAPTRDAVRATGLPYVIENVVGAPLLSPLMLCGSHFGLGVRRHRLFESNVFLMRQPGCQHTGDELAVYGKLDGRRIWTRANGSEVRAARTLKQGQTAMGIDWMGWDELREAIPPAYTEFIGSQLLDHVKAEAA